MNGNTQYDAAVSGKKMLFVSAVTWRPQAQSGVTGGVTAAASAARGSGETTSAAAVSVASGPPRRRWW
ncbi:hypothetical protein [Streptosporangium sp. NPDC023615]|uniref:hypothetical protein n=1 Tax=Streptosporangium sp. NPDC023615 TaxID=3154794 RepID=UPI003413B714